MQIIRVICIPVLAGSLALAQGVPKLDGMGKVHHPVSTKNAEAQAYFDQGLALVYAFNHDEAGQAFRRAAELDPNLAMAHWGVALIYGSNYNLPPMPDREQLAASAMEKAVALAPKASPAEQAYIKALSARYTKDPNVDRQKLGEAYAAAMHEIAAQYPDDLDAATLYAESMMNLRPWALWSIDGTAAPGTDEIVRTLESVLKRDPNHTGANHYYIHAVEGSANAARALPSADRLGALAPAAGHLVHMPSHIYARVGDFDSAARVNIDAAKADEAYIARTKAGPGIYTMMYYSHNIHFESHAASMDGRFTQSLAAANKLEAHVAPHVKDMPMVVMFGVVPTMVLDRFHRSDDVLKLPQPAADFAYGNAIWHYARGMALASKGNLTDAAKEQQALQAISEKIPADAMAEKNPLRTILTIADGVLAARIAREKKDFVTAEAALKKAVDAQDHLVYIEPPEWFFPVRESLGGLYLAMNQPADAEKTFRTDLEHNPRNGRSLFGLMVALKRQGKNDSAASIERQFNAAWAKADTKLTESEL